MLIEDVGIVGRQCLRLFKVLQRLGWTLERVLGLAEIAPYRGNPRIGFDRRTEQASRFTELTLLHPDRAEEIEGVEIAGRGFEDPRVDLLGRRAIAPAGAKSTAWLSAWPELNGPELAFIGLLS